MAGTKQRSIVLPVPTNQTYTLEVHDYNDDETIPNSIEESPQVRPTISWNEVENATSYKIYHTIFDTGTIESLLLKVPARSDNRIEVECPTRLEAKNGKWHSFRVESVDQFNNESTDETKNVAYYATDLPPIPNLTITRDTTTGLLSFTIV
jgi:hypothetical protein